MKLIDPLSQTILPNPSQELDLTLVTQTVAYIEVSSDQATNSPIGDLPTVVTDYDFGQLDGTYIPPPIYYPSKKNLIPNVAL